mgnify:CR=1 FL=1
MSDEMLTTSDIRKRTGLRVPFIRKLWQAGLLNVVWAGRTGCVKRDEFEAWLAGFNERSQLDRAAELGRIAEMRREARRTTQGRRSPLRPRPVRDTSALS